MDKTIIEPYKGLDLKIYAYTLPEVPSHDGYVKVGETTRKIKKRIYEQVGTAGLNPEILFERPARRSDGTWFHDKSLHRFFQQNGIPKKRFNNYADEWFYFNGVLEKAEILTDKYINRDYDEVQIDEFHSDYVLRDEQFKAVELTLDYYNSGKEPREFLWNAKPRFGKTLTAYDFIRRINAKNVLIVTNRPAIANSWFDDFEKFIAWQEKEMKFVSEVDSLKNKALSRDDFINHAAFTEHGKPSQIAFISLQDLKGAKFAGGTHKKLKWVGQLDWDILIIDEAHEGIDTIKTDIAFDKIERDFTLHLSGTPFKALASNKFGEEQIFNWSYVDEQESKADWDYTIGSNPYENLPTLNLFTYQMSKIIEERVSRGLTLDDGSNVDYAFDLNEFFRVKENGRFEYEESVKRFLDNICTGKFPFSEGKHRDKLNHTLWLLSRVNSAKALEKLLKSHPVFSEYEIILAAGDGISIDYDSNLEERLDFRRNEKSYNKVKKAISENEKTITLSVGQLTTGVTIPEWSAVFMLSNIKSPSLYFQAAFRAQNSYEFVKDDKLHRKENAYIFDFAPDRTLLLFDEFANNLSSGDTKTTEERKKKIKKLLNFFPVIGEDEKGNMHELDATEVLIIPTRIKSTEVVKRGFMSNLLFANIAGIFRGDSPFKEILDKIKPEKNKRLTDPREVNITDPMIDDEGNIDIPTDVVINKTEDIFGPAIYEVIETSNIFETSEGKAVADKINSKLRSGFNRLGKTFKLNKTEAQNVKTDATNEIKEVVHEIIEKYKNQAQETEEYFSDEIKKAQEIRDEARTEELKVEYEQKKAEINQIFSENLSTEVNDIIETAVEEQITKGEERKKKTTEDDVRDHLRGFARTIPAFLMAYGSEDTTLADFEENIDMDTFKELTGITIDEFRKLRDGFDYIDKDGNNRKVPGLFNEVVFNTSIREFFNVKKRLSNYFDETLTEDIFDYIPPQETNQIFTPRKVVKLMVDLIDEENPEIFSNYNVKFLDLYAKSGLYIAEIVRRLNKGLQKQIPNPRERIKWILENQVYAFTPSNIINNIVKNYIFSDFNGISDKNIVQCDVAKYINEGGKREKLAESFGGEDLKFDVIIGNPLSPLRPFGFRGYFVKDERFRPNDSGLSNPILCYGRGKMIGYLERHEVTVHSEWIDLWKVFTPRANNIGTELSDDNLNTFIGKPSSICTESYIVIGAELGLDEISADNLSIYLTTKFARYLHSLAKSSHDATAKTYRFIPLQDFSNNSDIDWTISVKEVDKQLYKKYGFSEDEISHIEGRIKEMQIE